MGLILHKEGYTLDSVDLYRVSSEVGGKTLKFTLQCLQTKTDGEIETIIENKLIERGYSAGDLTPITWN